MADDTRKSGESTKPKPPPPMLPKIEFYMYVGLCITAWAEVEEELFDICTAVLGTTRERASIVFYRLPLLSVRLALVDELVLSALPRRKKKDGGHDHTDVKTWKELKVEIEGLFGTRSRIAHHPVEHGVAFKYRESGEFVPIGRPVPIEQTTFETSYWLYVSQGERLRGRHEDLKALKADDLSLHCQHVQRLAKQVNYFRAAKLETHLKQAVE